MEFGQLMTGILVYVSCKFEMYIFKIAQVISKNVRIAFLYVLSIHVFHIQSVSKPMYALSYLVMDHQGTLMGA